MITEHCCYGNLRNFLLEHRHDFVNQVYSNVPKEFYFPKLDELQFVPRLAQNQTAIRRYEFNNFWVN